MSIFQILMISIGLSFDIFAVCVCEGAMLVKIEKKKLAAMCAIFCLWQLVSVVLGNLVTFIPVFSNTANGLQFIWRVLSTVIFFALAAFMIFRALRKESFTERLSQINFKEVCVAAFLVSLDAFFAGIGFGIFNAQFVIVCVVLEIVSILFCILGMYTGYQLGYEQKQHSLLIGGIVLLIASLDILIRLIL
jgi:putative Mn2+ efflux pump MntP